MTNGTPSLEETPFLRDNMINLRRARDTDQEKILKKMKKLFKMLQSKSPESNPSGTSVSNPARSSVSNPSGSQVTNLPDSSVSNPSRSSLFNPPDSSVSNLSGCSLSDPSRSSVINTPDSSVSNQSGPSTSKKYRAEKREAVIKTLKDTLRPSVSSPSESSVSNLSGSSVSNPTGTFISNPSSSSISNPSGSSEVEEDVTADEEANSKHEELNKSDINELVPIGSGKTKIHKDLYRNVNWKSYTIATRTLLLAAFSRSVLATHSLTGKKSPAFQDKPAKMRLDQVKTDDIIWEITSRFQVERSLVRSIITTKCADECKMWKARCKNNRNVPIT